MEGSLLFPPEKTRSFARNASDIADGKLDFSHLSPADLAPDDHHDHDHDKDPSSSSDSNTNLSQILDDVDRFLDALPATQFESDPPEVPNSVELLSQKVDSMISKYNANVKKSMRFGKDPDLDSSFLEAVKRISQLSQKLADFPSNSSMASALNRTSSILQRAMSFMDEEFRLLLEDNKSNKESDDHHHQHPGPNLKFHKTTTKQSSFNGNHNHNHDTDRCILPSRDPEPEPEDEYPGFSPETISNMNKIATAMIAAGYETECHMAFSISRRTAFRGALDELGFDNLSIDDIHKMSWESLQGEIATWSAVVRLCSTVLLNGERKLCDSIFSCNSSMADSLFSNLARAVAIQILNFAEAVVLTKRSAEKLFKILDMYETLRDLIPVIRGSYPDGSVSNELVSEAETAKSRLGEVAVSIFCELENSIKNDNGRTPVASGTVHPLTRYVVNYLKYACELYKESLEQVFQQHVKMNKKHKNDVVAQEDEEDQRERDKDNGTCKASSFGLQLLSVMDLLQENIEMKSKLYRDPSLRFIFLMNNGRYILQKIKGSSEIHQLMGNTWCRKKSSALRGYHKNYQRETWGRVLQCLSHEGMMVNGKISKPVLKERFKTFNAMFDDIHKTQSTWVVSDEQLQSELRISVSAVMIPAYRSFLGRFKQNFDSGKQVEKYIKYQPEDIETMIDDLFDGNATSMARRRT